MFNDVQYETTARAVAKELVDFHSRQAQSPPSREEVQRAIDDTFCFVTARRNGELIGFARGVTVGRWGRLAECKLDPAYQGPACLTRTDGRIEHDAWGIARQMAAMVIEKMRGGGVEKIEALAHGTEIDFCEELGFRRMRGLVAMELPGNATVSKQAPATAPVAMESLA